jgi:hypothetical protein
MTLLVRDESDILEDNLKYHLSRGIDFFIITDNKSMDGTREIVERYAQRGLAEIIDEPDDNYKQAEWVTRMARLAYSKYEADWIINADADEFWWPRHENLKTSLEKIPANYGALAAAVLHFHPRSGNGPPVQRMIFRNRLRDKLKVCHRGIPDVVVGYGNHTVEQPDLEIFPDRRLLTVFHYPRRTYLQYETKVINGGKALLNNPDIPQSLWNARYKDWQERKLYNYWKKNLELNRLKIFSGMISRQILIDKRLSNYMKVLDS